MGGLARLRDNRIEDIAGRHAAAGGPVLDMVLGLIPHAAGGVWIAARNGLFRAERERLRRVETALGELPVLSALDRPGAAPLVVGHHRLIEDPEGEARELPIQPGMPPILSAARSAEGLWLGTVGRLFLIDANGRVRSHEVALREIERIRVDAAGGLWHAIDQGLWRRLPGGKAQQLDVPGIDARAWVRAVFEDRESTPWVGTQLGGLHRACGDRFRRLGVRDGLPPGAVWAVLEGRDGRLWACTPDGLYEGGLGGFRKLFGAEDLPHPMVVAVAEDAAGGLWIGTRYGLAHRPPGATCAQAVSAFGDNIVHALLIDVDGSLLVAGADGLMRLREGRVEAVPLAPTEGSASISALSFDHHGRLRSRPVETSAGPVRLTGSIGSIGYAVYQSRDVGVEDDWQFTLTLADAATYAAKREGSDRAIGITLEREPPADGFGSRLLADLETLRSEGWLRLLRSAGADTDAESAR